MYVVSGERRGAAYRPAGNEAVQGIEPVGARRPGVAAAHALL